MSDTILRTDIDDLCTAVGVYQPDGSLIECNLALAQWLEGDEGHLSTVFKGVDLARVFKRVSKGEYVGRASAKNAHGQEFPVDLVLRRRHPGDESSSLILEGRDATSVVQQEVMLKSFSSLIEENNRKLRQATAEMEGLLNGMRQAVFAVGQDLNIVAPVSAHADRVFGKKVEGLSVLEAVFKDIPADSDAHSRLMTVLLTVFGNDELQWDMVHDQLPDRISYQRETADGSTAQRWLDISYSPLWSAEGLLERVIFAVTDVTERLAMQAAIDQERQSSRMTLVRLEQLAGCDVTALETFFHASATALTRISQAVQALHKGTASPQDLEGVMRDAHTIKGNSRTLGLLGLVEAAHRFESAVVKYKEAPSDAPDRTAHLHEAQELLRALTAEFRDYSRPAHQVFRIDDFLADETGIELSRCFDELCIGLVTARASAAAAKEMVLRSLHSAKGIARQLGDMALADALHAAENAELQSSVLVSESMAEKAENIALHRCMLLAAAHLPKRRTDRAAGLSGELIEALNGWTQGWQALSQNERLTQSHRCAAMAKQAESSTMSIVFQQVEALCALPGNTVVTQTVTQLLSDFYELVALQLAVAAAGMSGIDRAVLRDAFDAQGRMSPSARDASREVSDLLDLQGDTSRTLAAIGALWRMSPAEVAGLVFAPSEVRTDWCATVNSAITRAESLAQVQDMLEAGGVPDSGLWAVCRRAIASTFRTIQPSAVASIARLMAELQSEENPGAGGGERMARVPEKLLAALEAALADAKSSPDKLVEVARNLVQVPAQTIAASFKTMVPEIAKSIGKRARLSIDARGAMLSKRQAPLVAETILHLLRNAVDHGIEPPEEREAEGKDAEGHIMLKLHSEGGWLHLALSDDGRGIDTAKVQEAAARLGAAKPGEAVSEDEALKLILLPGLSTARSLSQISGRGVGMDIVATNTKKLDGQLRIKSTFKQGCRFEISFPIEQ